MLRPSLILVAAAQAADAATFAIGVHFVGIGAELNPLTQAAYRADGLGMALALKVALAVALLSLVALMRYAPRWNLRLAVAIAAGLGLAGAIGNTLAAAPHLIRLA